MSQKFASTIAGASIFISLLGLLSRGLGFIREMIFANNFGLELEFDLYLVGAVLPITINTVLLYIGQNYFIPEFQRVSISTLTGVNKYYKKSVLTFTLAGMLVAIILFFTSGIIIDLYMQSASLEAKNSATKIFNLFLVTIPFSATISILSALLQTAREFRYPAISILFLNISIIIVLIFFSDNYGVYIIPLGYVIGTIFQFIYLLIKSRKILEWRQTLREYEINLPKSILNSSILVIILIEAISQLYLILDRYFYSEMSSGGIASLSYALIIWFLPVSIFSISLATVVFPAITKSLQESSNSEVEKIYNESIIVSIFIFMPIGFILFFFGDTIIRILFERGKFDSVSTEITYGALKFYSISLVFYSIYAVLNKIFYSLNEAKLLLIVTLAGILLKLAFNFLLIDLKQNGLALSSSISYFFFFCVSYLVLNSKLKIKSRFLFAKDFFIHFSNGLICIMIVMLCYHFLNINFRIKEILLISMFIFLYFVNLTIIGHHSIDISLRVIMRSKILDAIR
jgi:putative peptidoglycan lipid II flippase